MYGRWQICLCIAVVIALVSGWSQVEAAAGNDRPAECSLPSDAGWCRAAAPRYFFNPESQRCHMFIYGGCHGNANNFFTRARCQRHCHALEGGSEEHDGGWQFPAISGFETNNDHHDIGFDIISVLHGNNNNDNNNGNDVVAQVCFLPASTGPCRGYSRMWYYNVNTGQCELFVYGLCGGNRNRFDSESDCLALCGGSAP